MSIAEIDIYRVAQMFIDKHGDAALLEAMKKEENLSLKGDGEGAHTWHKITNAIEWMQMPKSLTGETLQ